MLQTVLEIAKSCGYEQAELEVIATNEPAIYLYKSFGFEIYGRFPRNMKYMDGTYVDTYWMMKVL
jgi:ribosomal protein S18 acetylase RimI-like enzyme